MQRAGDFRDGTASPERVSDLSVLFVLVFVFAVQMAHAGGPRWVAGSSYFDSSVQGRPIVWANGQVTYSTDLGNLS
ncbi:MAG TPA: hypothetical protein VHE33_10335, partial [Acidobacteriaceae bacterium]|nr:hypothetical protein [Acidobacteriaceae bacterium]